MKFTSGIRLRNTWQKLGRLVAKATIWHWLLAMMAALTISILLGSSSGLLYGLQQNKAAREGQLTVELMVQMNLAQMDMDAGRYTLARQRYEFVIGEDTIPWGYLENRPYLKLLMERAMSIEFGGKVSKSIPYYEEILRLNPSDNQGIRDVLATLYLKTNQLEKVLELGKQYPDDLMQELLMGRVLALFKLGRVEEAEQLIMRRYREVKHVAKEILQRKHLQPESYQPDRMTVGGEDEAYHYYLAQGGLWEGTKGAKEWLRGVEVR